MLHTMRRRFIAMALFALLFALGWWAGRGGASSDLYSRIDTFVEILHKVEENYVEPVEPERLIHGAVHGMLRDLDPYADYLDPRDRSSAAVAPASVPVATAGAESCKDSVVTGAEAVRGSTDPLR